MLIKYTYEGFFILLKCELVHATEMEILVNCTNKNES